MMARVESAVRMRALQGALVGIAVGDALGLPFEKLAPPRVACFLKEPLGYRLIGRRGLVSDDAELALMTLRALGRSGGHSARFVSELAHELRLWLATFPAGIGLATARAIVKLWLAIPPSRSGVCSAGSAPALRATVLGVALAGQPQRWQELCILSTKMTHADPKAVHGSLVAGAFAELTTLKHQEPLQVTDFISVLDALGLETPLRNGVEPVLKSVEQGETTEQFVLAQGWRRGVSGFVYHTVPVALHAWLSNPQSFEGALASVIRCGGDTDTIGALLGGWMGAHRGMDAIPKDWLENLRAPIFPIPQVLQMCERVVHGVERSQPAKVSRPLCGLRVVRNSMFLLIVLYHGFRRLLPPYGGT